MSCRGSTLENYKASTPNASIDDEATVYLFEIRELNNCFILHVHKELAECINLEDVDKELNDHAANSVHFPPKKKMARV